MVEREEHTRFACTPNAASPIRVRRAAGGQWFVDMKVDVTVTLPDGREVIVSNEVTVKATKYVGFKRRGPAAVRSARCEP
jgi:hypothetical protein